VIFALQRHHPCEAAEDQSFAVEGHLAFGGFVRSSFIIFSAAAWRTSREGHSKNGNTIVSLDSALTALVCRLAGGDVVAQASTTRSAPYSSNIVQASSASLQ
jgi:cytochrome bd-type quinol oxidase subunit 1